MESLQLKTCLALVHHQNLTLQEISQLVDRGNSDVAHQLRISCGDNPLFWKYLLIQFYGKLSLMSRLDISDRDLRAYVRTMNKTTRYLIRGDFDNNLVTEGPMIVSEHDQRPHPLDDSEYIYYHILGSQPLPGCIGYVCRFYFDEHIQTRMSTPQYFISRADQFDQLWSLMRNYLVLNFVTVANSNIPDGPVTIADQFNFGGIPTVQELYASIDPIFLNAVKIFDGVQLKFSQTFIPMRRPTEQSNLLVMFIDVAQISF